MLVNVYLKNSKHTVVTFLQTRSLVIDVQALISNQSIKPYDYNHSVYALTEYAWNVVTRAKKKPNRDCGGRVGVLQSFLS